jgi:hypothetical protein
MLIIGNVTRAVPLITVFVGAFMSCRSLATSLEANHETQLGGPAVKIVILINSDVK